LRGTYTVVREGAEVRISLWCLAVAAASGMAGCGGDDPKPTSDHYSSCPGPAGWSVVVSPPGPLTVGATARVDVVPFTFSSQAAACAGQVRFVEWTTSEPGIVSFSPGSSPSQATLKAEVPGETVLGARITFPDGTRVQAAGQNVPATLRVVP
jgi:hypothetical protein